MAMGGSTSKKAAQPATMPQQAPVPPMAAAGSYTGPEVDRVEFFCGNAQSTDSVVMVWLPGSGQRADNELLRRLVNALHSSGVHLWVVGLSGIARLQPFLDRQGKQRRVVLGGHSMGGAAATAYCEQGKGGRAEVCALITANAATQHGGSTKQLSVAALAIIGQNDPATSGLKHLPAFTETDIMVQLIPPTGGTAHVLYARNGDHSLRYNSSASAEAKDKSCTSEETVRLNASVAEQIKVFLATVL